MRAKVLVEFAFARSERAAVSTCRFPGCFLAGGKRTSLRVSRASLCSVQHHVLCINEHVTDVLARGRPGANAWISTAFTMCAGTLVAGT